MMFLPKPSQERRKKKNRNKLRLRSLLKPRKRAKKLLRDRCQQQKKEKAKQPVQKEKQEVKKEKQQVKKKKKIELDNLDITEIT